MPHADPHNLARLDGEELVEKVVQRKTLFRDLVPDFRHGSHVIYKSTKGMHWENVN